MKVELSAEAEAQVGVIDAWWQDNRRAAPDLFANELAHTLTALADTPGLGIMYQAGLLRCAVLESFPQSLDQRRPAGGARRGRRT